MADRKRAEPLGIHLAEPAGFETRRHQCEIASGKNASRLFVVEADLYGDRTRRALLRLQQRLFKTRFALAGDDDLAAGVDDRLRAFENEINTFFDGRAEPPMQTVA